MSPVKYFTETSLYLVRLKIFEWTKFLRRHLHQFQGNGAGRNFLTASRQCRVWIQGSLRSLRMQECRDECEIYNYQRIHWLPNNKFINRILRSTLLGLTVTFSSGASEKQILPTIFSYLMTALTFYIDLARPFLVLLLILWTIRTIAPSQF